MKKLLRGVLVAMLSVTALYYVGVNALLASPWGPALFNQRPGFVQIRYTRAWTLVPLQLEVRGFQLSMQDSAVQLVITADEVRGNLHPWTLRQLRFRATEVEASGVSLRVRPRVFTGDALVKHFDELPAIAGFESVVEERPSHPAPHGPLLTLEFAHLTVHHLREVWIERLHYTGDAEVTGGMRYEPLRRLRLDDAHVTDAKATVVALAARDLDVEQLEARVDLQEIDLQNLDLAALRGLTAEVKLAASAEPEFLNSYLTSVPGLASLRASGAEGHLELALQVKDGVVEDGARLAYRSARLAVRLPLVEVHGAAAITGKATDGRLGLEVAITDAALRQRDGTPLVTADQFLLHAGGPADLANVVDVDAVLSLRGGHLKNLVALNQFIPTGAGVHLAAGTGLLEGTLRMESIPPRIHGQLALTARDVVVKNRSATITGQLVVDGQVRSFDPRSGRLDLSGSSIAIQEANVQTKARRWPHLWLRAETESCVVSPKGPLLWDAKLALSASNLAPLLAVVSANLPLPGALMLFSDSANVQALATVRVRDDGVELPSLLLTSQKLRAEGTVSLRELAAEDKRLEPWGNVLARAGVLKVGLEFAGPKVTVVLLGVEKWAAERKLEMGTPSPPPAPPRGEGARGDRL